MMEDYLVKTSNFYPTVRDYLNEHKISENETNGKVTINFVGGAKVNFEPISNDEVLVGVKGNIGKLTKILKKVSIKN